MPDRSRRPIRCAIYTRKSSEEGLEQDFNSLQAQREACEAYIKSQRHEGWKLLETAYDDGGFSGGTMERPGLKRLLEDIHARRVDIVVVYKVDRLTRSLADFAKIVETFDSQNVSFVSVTQQFNTTTSMGRLTLNVLLSFAQFEREVTGERIRDKVAASKKKGMWMGGYVPLGYRAIQKRLIINEPEAKLIREIFSLYLKRKNVRLVAEDLQLRKIIRPATTAKTGRAYGKTNFSRGLLYKMLSNPIYVGEIEHRGERFKSQHEAIVDQKTWNSVQQLLAKNAKERKFPTNAKAPNLLAGLLFDEQGGAWTASHTSKGSRRYRYYVSAARSGQQSKHLRIAAHEIENAVIGAVQSLLNDRAKVLNLIGNYDSRTANVSSILNNAKMISERLRYGNAMDKRRLLTTLVHQVVILKNEISLEIARKSIVNMSNTKNRRSEDGFKSNRQSKRGNGSDNIEESLFTVKFPARFNNREVATRFVVDGNENGAAPAELTLLKSVARAVSWFEDLRRENVVDLAKLATRERMTTSSVARILRLAFLEPAIVGAVLDGGVVKGISARQLMRTGDLHAIWANQRILLGIKLG